MCTKMLKIVLMIILLQMITVRLKLLIKASGLMIAIKGFLTVAKIGKQGAPDSTGACLMGRLPHAPLRSTPNGVGLRSLLAAKLYWSHIIFLFFISRLILATGT